MRQQVCRNVVPAGWQVCPFEPTIIRMRPTTDVQLSQSITELALESRYFGYTSSLSSDCVERAFTSA